MLNFIILHSFLYLGLVHHSVACSVVHCILSLSLLENVCKCHQPGVNVLVQDTEKFLGLSSGLSISTLSPHHAFYSTLMFLTSSNIRFQPVFVNYNPSCGVCILIKCSGGPNVISGSSTRIEKHWDMREEWVRWIAQAVRSIAKRAYVQSSKTHQGAEMCL